MNTKKIVIISLILMFLLVPVSFADDGDYTIPSAVKDIIVEDDGSTIITEEIVYDVEGSINGVYRTIPHNTTQSVTNISVETPGYYNTVKVIEEYGQTKIKVWLYTDENKTRRTYNAHAVVKYHYTFNKGVKIYNDIAELQYMTWGNEWESPVTYLESNIHLPGSKEDTQYWNNPDDYVVSSNWTSPNTWTTISEGVGARTSYEQRIIMPKSFFKSTENAQVINIDAKDQIISDQNKYIEQNHFKNMLMSVIMGILGILMIIPVGIYLLFGREPKIDYNKEYEFDLPTDATPIQVNSIVVGDVDNIDENGMYATVLDLLNRKYLKVISSNDDDIIIRRTDKDSTSLKEFEQLLLSYLSKFEVNNNISLKSIGDMEDPEIYTKFKNSWISSANKEVPKSLITRYFYDKGSTLFKSLALILLVASILLFILLFLFDLPGTKYMIFFALSVFLFIESMIMFYIPNTFAGRWTPEGKEFHDKWKSFENYIKDFSLINERPPASIEVWGKYLVYAAALGCADEVSKNMKKYLDLKQVSTDYLYNNSDVVYFTYFGGYDFMHSSFSSLAHTETDSGGIGSVGGGGFGGGGGGTF